MSKGEEKPRKRAKAKEPLRREQAIEDQVSPLSDQDLDDVSGGTQTSKEQMVKYTVG